MSIQKMFHSILALLICLGIHSTPSLGSTLPTNSNYSGEELFEGIFFLKGEVAQILPEIAEKSNLRNLMDRQQKKDFLIIQQMVTKQIKQKHPSFFTNFKKDLESKNHQKILSALENGANLIAEIVNSSSPVNRMDIDLKELSKLPDNPSKKDIDRAKNQVAKIVNGKTGESNKSSDGDITHEVAVVTSLVWIVNTVYNLVSLHMVPISMKTSTDSKSMLFNEKLVNSIIKNT